VTEITQAAFSAPNWGSAQPLVETRRGRFLHDGRPRNFTEAILWHRGEAEVSREAFRKMSKPDREALLAFRLRSKKQFGHRGHREHREET
jgi:CxxC motif-containing protein (DUF1111 family)